AEALIEHLISRKKLAAKVQRQQEPDNERAPDDVTKSELQEFHAAWPIGLAGDAEHSCGARFGGDDRAENGPPGKIPVSEQVIFETLGLTADRDADHDRRGEVQSQDDNIDPAEVHGTNSQ